MKKYARLYLRFTAQSLKTLMEYKMDFFIGLSGFVVTQAIGIIFLYIVFQRIPTLNGWSYNDVLFIYAFSQLPRGVDHLLTDNLWMLSGKIILRGEFDKYLLKPINPLFHVIAEKFQTDAFGELIVGFILLIYSLIKLRINISFFNVVLFILLVFCGTIIYTSIKVFFASFAFWVKNSQNILVVNYSLSDFTKYPIGIYPKAIRIIITFVMPFAFTAYFPAAYFVNKETLLVGVGGTIAASIVAAIVAYFTWCKGINAYESAGS